MYREFFGITEKPFSLTPNPRYLFMSRGHQEALAHLLYGMAEGGGFVLLTGEVGTGKTSICRCFIEQLPDHVDLALILNPRLTEIELLGNILDELGIEYPADCDSLKVLVDRLNHFLIDAHSDGRKVVVMIDEAQNLSAGVLEQIRLLTNLQTTQENLLQIMLVGQPELITLLERQELRQLNQRVTARYHLMPLSAPDTKAYIRHRLAVAGLGPDCFTPGALRLVWKRSRGVPRLINNICDRCLLGAYAQASRQVDRKIAKAAAGELTTRRGNGSRRLLPWGAAAGLAAATIAFLYFQPPSLALLARVFQGDTAAAVSPDPESEPAVASEAADKAAPAVREPLVQTAATAPAAERQISRPAEAPAAETRATEASAEAAEPEASHAAADIEETSSEPIAAAPTQKPSSGSALSENTVPTAAQAPATAPVQVTPASSQPEAVAAARLQTALLTPPAPEAAQPAAAPPAELSSQELFGQAALLADPVTGGEVLLRQWRRLYGALRGETLCEKARDGGLACIEGKRGSWDRLAELNRPALITLTSPEGKRLSAVVTALSSDEATLTLGTDPWRLKRDALAKAWTGEYLVLWQPPTAEQRLLAQGLRGKDVTWLKNRLAGLRGAAADAQGESLYDAALRKEVEAFQRSQGLKPDGLVGPQTMIHLNSLSGSPVIPLLLQPKS